MNTFREADKKKCLSGFNMLYPMGITSHILEAAFRT